MIIQTKASILAVMLGLEGGKTPHRADVLDDIIISRAIGEAVEIPETVSNDRTQLKHHKNTET